MNVCYASRFLNDNQQLMISSIFYSNENPTQIQIIESKLRRYQSHIHDKTTTTTDETTFVIESKLVITNTLSSQHTGKYSCMTVIDDQKTSPGLSRHATLATNRVSISVLSAQQLDGWDKSKGASVTGTNVGTSTFRPGSGRGGLGSRYDLIYIYGECRERIKKKRIYDSLNVQKTCLPQNSHKLQIGLKR